MMLLQEDYQRILDMIYSFSGMALKGDKYDYVARRVKERVRDLDMSSTRDYCRFLMLNPRGEEVTEFINRIVVGETYFFREFQQLQLFAEEILPEIVEKLKKSSKKELKILSAGCATGEEPYTLAIIIKEMLDLPEQWKIYIDGIDINSLSIQRGKDGRYTDHALRETPYVYRDKYFDLDKTGYIIRPEIREMISLTRINLYDQEQMRGFYGYDVVFCRNVLIYFDHNSAARILENLNRCMKTDGYIFSGTAESIGRSTNLFKMKRYDKAFVYQK